MRWITTILLATILLVVGCEPPIDIKVDVLPRIDSLESLVGELRVDVGDITTTVDAKIAETVNAKIAETVSVAVETKVAETVDAKVAESITATAEAKVAEVIETKVADTIEAKAEAKIADKIGKIEAKLADNIDNRVKQQLGDFTGKQNIGMFAGDGIYMLILAVVLILAMGAVAVYFIRSCSKKKSMLAAITGGVATAKRNGGDTDTIEGTLAAIRSHAKKAGCEHELDKYLVDHGKL